MLRSKGDTRIRGGCDAYQRKDAPSEQRGYGARPDRLGDQASHDNRAFRPYCNEPVAPSLERPFVFDTPVTCYGFLPASSPVE